VFQHIAYGTIWIMTEWYEDGLCFACTQCGNCCTGPPGAVWFTDDEGRGMAEKLGIGIDSFYRQYARKIGSKWSLTERLVDGKYDCILLDRTTPKPSCSVYEARPSQCRSWPFWSENLKSREAWDRAKEKTPCPGMDTGPLIPVEAIRVLCK